MLTHNSIVKEMNIIVNNQSKVIISKSFKKDHSQVFVVNQNNKLRFKYDL